MPKGNYQSVFTKEIKMSRLAQELYVYYDVLRCIIFKTYCMSLYGSQLCDYDDTYINRVYVAWRKAIRKLFNISNITHCNLLPYICNDSPPCVQLSRRVISFVKGLSSSHNVLSSICYKLAMHGSDSAISNSISVISSKWAIPQMFVPNITRDTSIFQYDATLARYGDIVRDLFEMRRVNTFDQSTIFFSNEEIKCMVDALCIY